MEIKIVKGDITTLAVDAIVNTANQVMLGNAPKKLVSEGNFERSENPSNARALKRSRDGVDGAIHRAAGKELFGAGCECVSGNRMTRFLSNRDIYESANCGIVLQVSDRL